MENHVDFEHFFGSALVCVPNVPTKERREVVEGSASDRR
jgi:hypothetical protein